MYNAHIKKKWKGRTKIKVIFHGKSRAKQQKENNLIKESK